jgi:hypothetical protein
MQIYSQIENLGHQNTTKFGHHIFQHQMHGNQMEDIGSSGADGVASSDAVDALARPWSYKMRSCYIVY